MTAWSRRVAAAVALVVFAASAARAQQALSVKDVMGRVGDYVASYGEKAAIVVGTERYEQHASPAASGGPTSRTLVSDFAIVRTDAARGWTGFRDVIQVDGRVLHDRQDRLVRVLIAAEGEYDEAVRVQRESARYNIGILGRDFNIPTAALFFFLPRNHDRFTFKARGVEADGTWAIEFRETSKPTLIRTPEGESIPSSGTLWVKPDNGVVVRTVLEADMGRAGLRRRRAGRVHIDVTFQHIAKLDMWLPLSMDERVEARRSGEWQTATGRADYSDYRKFTTSVRIK